MQRPLIYTFANAFAAVSFSGEVDRMQRLQAGAGMVVKGNEVHAYTDDLGDIRFLDILSRIMGGTTN